MAKKIVNALKSEVEKLKYANLKSVPIKSDCWNSGYNTYIDLGRSHNLTINEKEVPNELIEKLYSKHKDLILEDEKGVFCKLCQTAFLIQLNFQSVRKENIKLRHG